MPPHSRSPDRRVPSAQRLGPGAFWCPRSGLGAFPWLLTLSLACSLVCIFTVTVSTAVIVQSSPDQSLLPKMRSSSCQMLTTLTLSLAFMTTFLKIPAVLWKKTFICIYLVFLHDQIKAMWFFTGLSRTWSRILVHEPYRKVHDVRQNSVSYWYYRSISFPPPHKVRQ